MLEADVSAAMPWIRNECYLHVNGKSKVSRETLALDNLLDSQSRLALVRHDECYPTLIIT